MCSSDLDPPAVCAVRGQRIDRPADCTEVMMTLSVPGGAVVIEDPEDSPRASRAGRPPLERPQDPADMAGPSGTALHATIERLGMPLEVNADPVLARAQLEEFRKTVIREAKEVARTQEEYEMIVAEYNGAQEFTPVAKGPHTSDACKNVCMTKLVKMCRYMWMTSSSRPKRRKLFWMISKRHSRT